MNILFDLDNTLCNFSLALQKAKEVTEKQLPCNENIFWEYFKKINSYLNNSIEKGEISWAQYRLNRFTFPLHQLGYFLMNDQVDHLATIFTNTLNSSVELYDDVLPFFDFAQRYNIKLFLLTNGPSDGQRQKLNVLGIADKFIDIFIAEEMGIYKPNANAFSIIINRWKLNPADTYSVGDNIETDIIPAKNIGLNTYLINRKLSNENISEKEGDLDNLKRLIINSNRQ